MSRKLLAGTVLLSAAILAIVFSMNEPSAVYSRSVSDFVAHPTYDRKVRVEGMVVPGSLCYRDNPCEYRFRVEDRRYSTTDAGVSAARPELSVRYLSCVVPDTFRPMLGVDLPVTVEGRQCASCHHFEADMVFAKTSGKYEMKMRDARNALPPEPRAPIPVCPKS